MLDGSGLGETIERCVETKRLDEFHVDDGVGKGRHQRVEDRQREQKLESGNIFFVESPRHCFNRPRTTEKRASKRYEGDQEFMKMKIQYQQKSQKDPVVLSAGFCLSDGAVLMLCCSSVVILSYVSWFNNYSAVQVPNMHDTRVWASTQRCIINDRKFYF